MSALEDKLSENLHAAITDRDCAEAHNRELRARVAELEALYADLRDDWVYLHKRYDSPEESELREQQRRNLPCPPDPEVKP